MSATSETAIVNRALIRVGGSRITSLESDPGQGVTARIIYDQARDSLLVEEDWHFASARFGPLTATGNTPAYGYTYQYNLPSKFLHLRWVGTDPGGKLQLDKYELEGGFLLADSQNVYMRYTKRIEDTTKFYPLFVDALVAKLAMEFAISIAESGTLYDRMENSYRRVIDDATSADAIQSKTRKTTTTRRTRRRYRSRGSYVATEYNP